MGRASQLLKAAIGASLLLVATITAASLDCGDTPSVYPADCPAGICDKKTCNAFGASQDYNCNGGACSTATCEKFNPSCTQNCLGRTAGSPVGKLCILEDTTVDLDFRLCGGCVSCPSGYAAGPYTYPGTFSRAAASQGGLDPNGRKLLSTDEACFPIATTTAAPATTTTTAAPTTTTTTAVPATTTAAPATTTTTAAPTTTTSTAVPATTTTPAAPTTTTSTAVPATTTTTTAVPATTTTTTSTAVPATTTTTTSHAEETTLRPTTSAAPATGEALTTTSAAPAFVTTSSTPTATASTAAATTGAPSSTDARSTPPSTTETPATDDHTTAATSVSTTTLAAAVTLPPSTTQLPTAATTESRVALRLAGDAWADVLAVNRPAVVAAVTADLAAAFGVAASAVTVHSLAAGSLVVDASVRHSLPSTAENATTAVVAEAGYGSLESAYVAQSNATLPPGGLSVLDARVQDLPFFPGATPSPDGAGRTTTAGFFEECTIGCKVIIIVSSTLIVVIGIGVVVFLLVTRNASDEDAKAAAQPYASAAACDVDGKPSPTTTRGDHGSLADLGLGSVPAEQLAASAFGNAGGGGGGSGLQVHDPMLTQTLGNLFARRDEARRAARVMVEEDEAIALAQRPGRRTRRDAAAEVARANAHPDWAQPLPDDAPPTTSTTAPGTRRVLIDEGCNCVVAIPSRTPPCNAPRFQRRAWGVSPDEEEPPCCRLGGAPASDGDVARDESPDHLLTDGFTGSDVGSDVATDDGAASDRRIQRLDVSPPLADL